MRRLTSALLGICTCLTLAAGARPLQQQSQEKRPETARGKQTKPKEKPVVEYLNPGGGLNLPFSEAVRVGDWLILSGQIGMDGSGKLVGGGVRAETKQVMENMRRVLEAHGSSLDHVVKCTVMLADMKEWGEMNEVYRTYFRKERLPARSALGVNGLALGARVEIECWAVSKGAEPRD